jgi:uncharacterized membrane protein (UPF0182 family)
LAWALDDVTKLPFSDDVTPESRALIHRNIREIVDGVAPFLVYDNDPYMVVNSEGRLFWIMDAFTESATYPFSRHYQAGDKTVNYIRNSVKVVIDAYNGTATFYVFDANDPLIQTYRAIFTRRTPTLSSNAKICGMLRASRRRVRTNSSRRQNNRWSPTSFSCNCPARKKDWSLSRYFRSRRQTATT